jgi:hypothetical protein
MRMILASCALAVLACAPGAPPSADQGAPVANVSVDTLRGTVEVVGSEPGTWVVLTDGRGGVVTLEGERQVLLALQALQVMVEGRMLEEEPRRFRVERVAVRSAHGVPAVDGVITREGGRLLLVTGDGRRLPVPHLPAQLAGKVGARVWLAGPLDRHPDTFGVIAEAPRQ